MFRRKKQPQVPEPPKIEVLDLEPGDTLVLLSDVRLTQDHRDYLIHQLQDEYPNQRCIVLDQQFSLKVLKNTEGATSND